MAKQVRTVYGSALFDAAREVGRLTAVREQAEVIIRVLDENPEFLQILNHPEISMKEKTELVNAVFSGSADPLITGTIVVLIEKEHGREIGYVLESFVSEALEEEKIGVASVTSAVQLTEDQKERIRKKLLDTTSYEAMRVHYKVDPKLIGGLIIRLGDRVVDSSLSSKLARMQRDLEAGSQEAI